MDQACRVLTSSIGKKVQVALAGLLLCFFLVSHLAGNLLLWAGPKMFDTYAEALEHNVLLPVAEVGLLVLFLLHVLTALRVRWENRNARPVGYQVAEWAGGRTVSSATMAATGLFILVFVVVHVKTMRFVDHGGEGLYRFVLTQFQSVPYSIFYLAAMVALGLHLNHGAQAAVRTFGVDHPRLTPVVQKAGLAFAVMIAGGFGALVFWACWLAGGR
ncbi:MAG: succinate dehydrogenase cytochrome b subunit [Elusimicrobia bacterium]|nr:succinate dehydrogenase cytochrome b subunit [Elusimicrobiota bacterium]